MASKRSVDVGALVAQARQGGARSARGVARLISLIERTDPAVLREVASALAPYGRNAAILGLTGAPGVGKSTATSALVAALRADGKRVGVLAVDPSSPFSGGALLGDRVRMQDHATDEDVFIRSMASRGQLGGLSAAVPQALRVLDAAGCDVVIVETVGVGQAEVEIASLADTTVLVLAPGFGDGIQAAKAGIIEVADVFVVNKADRDGADQVARDLRNMQSLGGRHSEAGSWRPPVVKTVAARAATDEGGIGALVAAIDKHRDWMRRHDVLEARRRERAATEVEAIALGMVRRRFESVHGSAALRSLAERVVDGRTDPYAAADDLVGTLR